MSDLDELAGLRPAWDELAVASASPRSAPAPVLAWYRHVMEPEAAPAVLVAREGDLLTGVLPLIVYKPRFRPVNCTVAGMGMLNAVEPVGLPGTEREVALAFGEALRHIDPVPDTLRMGYIDRRLGVDSCAAVGVAVAQHDQTRRRHHPALRGAPHRWI